jgi:hypothetical protein
MLLDQARRLEPEQYEEAKLSLVQHIVAALIDMGPPAPAQRSAAQSPEESRQAEMAEQRIRSKLDLAGEPYRQAQSQGEVTPAMTTAAEEAREALYEGRLQEAEEAADRLLALLGLRPSS